MTVQVAPRHARHFIQAIKLAGVSDGLTMGAIIANGDRIRFGVAFSEFIFGEYRNPVLWIIDNAPFDWINTTLYIARQDHEGKALSSRPTEIALRELTDTGCKAVVFYSESLNVVRQKL